MSPHQSDARATFATLLGTMNPSPPPRRRPPTAPKGGQHQKLIAPQGPQRLQRIMADAGVASRRVCEEKILAGRVRVNGEPVRELPVFADARKDRIEVDGVLIAKAGKRVVLALHKPARVLVTRADEPELDRATIMELVDHPAKATLYPVGRLPWDVNGLVILTNDGELTNRLTHPRFGVVKTYEVVVKGTVGDEEISRIVRQSKLVGKRETLFARREQLGRATGAAPAPEKRPSGPRNPWKASDIRVLNTSGSNTVVHIRLTETRGTPVADVLFAAGLVVRRVSRVGVGGLELRNLAVGRWRELTPLEIAKLDEPPAEPLLYAPMPTDQTRASRPTREYRSSKPDRRPRSETRSKPSPRADDRSERRRPPAPRGGAGGARDGRRSRGS